MAVLLDFVKVREDSQEVEYRFGPPEQMTRRLVIAKATGEGHSVDSDQDSRSAAVFVKILRYQEQTGRWPEKGSYAA